MASAVDEFCSLCLSVPDCVVLSCTHSLCSQCLQKNWREKPERKCPVCGRWSSLEWLPPLMSSESEAPQSETCRLHGEKLTLFCTEHQEALCVACREDHTDSCLRPLEKAPEYLKEEAKSSGPLLMSKLKQLDRAEKEVGLTEELITSQADKTVKLIQEQVQRLRESLQEQEESRIRAVRAEEEQKRIQLQDQKVKVNRTRADVTKALWECEKLQDLPSDQPPDSSALRRYKSLLNTARRPLQDEELTLGSGALLDQAKHLGNLSFHICSALSSEETFCPVVLDPNTCHPKLLVSADLRSLQRGRTNAPPNLRWDKHFVCALGSEGLTSGLHSWDVEVPNTNWALGVATKTSEGRPGQMWRLWFYRGKYRWWPRPGQASDVQMDIQMDVQMEVQTQVQAQNQTGSGSQHVRVVLDLDQEILSFFVGDSLVHSVSESFSGKTLFPVFHVHEAEPITILPQASDSAPSDIR